MNRLFFNNSSNLALLATVLFSVFVHAEDKTSSQSLEVSQAGESGVTESQLEAWIIDLGSDQFHRRKAATRKLLDAGPVAVPSLVRAMQSGDLDTIDRAVHCLTEIALTGPPDQEDGAWGELKRISSSAAASRAALVKSAVEEIREVRESQAAAALAQAGVTIGIDKFMVRAISMPQVVVQIDENWTGEIDSLGWLRWVKNIEFARVKGPAIRPDVISRLVEMPDLNTIAIVDGKVELETLRPLQGMQRVKSLEFRYVRLNDELANEIAKIPVRVSLNLMGTGISKEKVDQLRMHLPGLHIDLRQGGFLGVSCLPSFDVCQINEVSRGKPAQLAGLEPGDEIVGIDDTKISRFEDLQEAINLKVPGDEVEVKFLRLGKLQSVKLKLGKHDNE